MEFDNNGWIDISTLLYEEMQVFSGQVPFSINKTYYEDRQCTVTNINMSMHCGTHIDAPLHFIPNGKNIEEIPFNLLMGKVYVCAFKTNNDISKIPDNTTRLLFKDEGINGLKMCDIDEILAKGVKIIGTNRMCVANESEDEAVHKKLLKNDVWIIETLNLMQVESGYYNMVCLPLKIKNCEAAPARVLLQVCK